MTLTLSNLKADEGEEVVIRLKDEAIAKAEGRILTGRMDQYNDFGKEELKVESFSDFCIKDGSMTVKLPACSVAELKIG